METVIRTAGTPSQAEEWALVLAAAGIPHRLEPAPAGWTLLVPTAEAARAHAALDAYDQEARSDAAAASHEPAWRVISWTIGVAVGAFLLAFFLITGPPARGSRWFERGAASAGLMLRDEPWRAVTALTLHADAVHVAGNAVATALLLTAVVQRLGPGGGLSLTLLAGAIGNILAAMTHDASHVAVGASTATFGAIGILAGLRLFAASHPTTTRSRPWLVLAASVVLLAMLGTGRGSDVLAHALGLVSGMALGLAAAVVRRRPLGTAAQWALVGLTFLAVVGCWRLALAGTLGSLATAPGAGEYLGGPPRPTYPAEERRAAFLEPSSGARSIPTHVGTTASTTARRQGLRQRGELNEDSDPDTAASTFERENRPRNRARGPNGIRTCV